MYLFGCFFAHQFWIFFPSSHLADRSSPHPKSISLSVSWGDRIPFTKDSHVVSVFYAFFQS
jgi:hypothetical protein